MIFERTTSGDAIELLKEDHRLVESLFSQFESSEGAQEKVALAQQICIELSIHAQVEEEVFYPAARKALEDDDREMVAEATVEHTGVKQLIADIDGGSPNDDLFDAKVKVLSEYVKHHVKEEENELMPAVRRTNVDLQALGRKIKNRKEELTAEIEARQRAPRAGSAPRVRVPATSGRGRKSATAKRGTRRAPARKRAGARTATTKRATKKSSRSRGAAASKRGAAARKGTQRKARSR